MDSKQMSRHEKIFSLFSNSHSKTVETSDLRKLLLLAGHTVTSSEVRDLVSTINKEAITLEEFLEICNTLSKSDVTREDLKGAFQAIDPEDTGYVPLQLLVDILKEGNNELTTSEIEELVEILEPDANWRVNYGALINGCYESKPMEDR